MPPQRKSASKLSQARKWLSGQTEGGALIREDSDDELGYDDLPWEWVYATASDDASNSTKGKKKKRKRDEGEEEIVGAKMGKFECKLGDVVMLKAADNEAWVAVICDLGEDEDGEKQAYFMWFSSPAEIRNKGKKRSDFLPVRTS
jgi:origin recognition complex subunit 1